MIGRAMTAPPSRGLASLREATLQLERSTGRRVDPETEMLVTNGAMHALGICMRALLGRGDEVVVPAPCFFFDGPIRAAGARPGLRARVGGRRLALGRRRIERAIGARTRAVLLCNPVNPTGYVPAGEDVGAVVAAPSGTACWSSPTRPTRLRSGATRPSPPRSASRTTSS